MRLKPQKETTFLSYVGEDHEEYWFVCPGCKFHHKVIVKWGSKSGRKEPTWIFNGDLNYPTFQPSLLVRWGTEEGDKVCHSFITNGVIQFLSDCTHSLKGQSVPLLEVGL